MSKETFNTGSVRDDPGGKPKFHFLGECWDGLAELCDVLDHGAEHYMAGNWQKGQPVTRVVDSMMRHAMAIARGEDIDPKSGKTHRGHVMANACFLAHYARHLPKMEDRCPEARGQRQGHRSRPNDRAASVR